MKEKEKSSKKWVREHKKELIVTGIATTITIIAMLMLKKKRQTAFNGQLKNIIHKETTNIVLNDSIKNSIRPLAAQTSKRIPHSVRSHIRQLPEGKRASALKTKEAALHGYHLQPGQTWVVPYKTGQTA